MHIPNEIPIADVVEFLSTVSDESVVYIGCDSEKFRLNGEWWADFATVVVIHRNNCNGAKIFGAVVTERIYDKTPKHPRMRLMREVQLVAELYLKLVPEILNDIVIHLDINPNEIHGSSCVIHEAIGFIRGMCQQEPEVKPNAWAASFCADQLKRIMNYRSDSVCYSI